MATVYSSEVAIGSYNRIRIKCDYSGTSASLTIQFRRTSSYSTTWRDTAARLIFNGQDKDANYAYTGTVSTSWVDLRPTISGYTISMSGGTYNWQFTNPAGGVLACSGTLTIPAQSTVPTTPTTWAFSNGPTTIRATYGTTSFGTAGSGTVYLYGGTSASPTTQIDSKTTTGNSTFNIFSLTPNTKYYYRSRAKSSVGWSSYSADATTVTYSGFVNSTVAVSDYAATSITVGYTTRAGGGVYAQNIQYSLDGGTNWTTAKTYAAGTTASQTGSFNITGLTAGTTYTINTRVSTTVGNLDGPTLTQKTAKAPEKPTVTATTAGKATNTVTYGTTSFGYPNAGTIYLYGGTSTAPTTQLASKTTTGNSSYTHSSLTPNTKYYYRARALNTKNYWSNYSTEATSVTKGYLTAISVSSYTVSTIVISYTVGPGGGAYAQKVQYSIDGGTTWVTGATVAAGTTAATDGTFTISGLTSGTTYSIQTRVSTTAGNWTGSTLSQKTAVRPSGGTLSVTSKTYNTVTLTGSITSYGYPADGYVVIGLRDTVGSSARTEGHSSSYPNLSGSIVLTNNSTKKGGGCDLYGCRAVYPFLWANNYAASATLVEITTPVYLPPAPMATLIVTSLVTGITDVTANIRAVGSPADGTLNAIGAKVTTEYRYKVGSGSYSAWATLGSNENPDTVHDITLTELPFVTTVTVQARQSFQGEYSATKSLSFTTSPKPIGLYGSVNGAALPADKAYGSVNGVAKEIVKGYGSVNGVAKRIY